jgi:iron complex transport system permease protein
VHVRPLTLKRLLWTCGALAVVLLACMVLALKLGAVPISVTDLVLNLGRVAIGQSDQLPTEYRLIVFDLRLPRILLGILVGAALSVSGASFQAMLRNPLADPFILGVSSGAAVGSILATLLAPRFALITPLGAFLGAIATIAAVYFLGRREGELDSTTLLLGGVISASFLSAIVMFLMTALTGRDLRGTVFWLMGDLSTPIQPGLQWIFSVGLLAGIGAIYTTAADLNLLLTGEREAIHLGVEVTRVKLVVYVSASLLTGLAVSASGTIGYVGLLVPHAVRLLFGPDYRLLIPACALCGAIAIVLADTLARTVAAPTELPVGAMTAMAGAPVFIYLLRRGMR